MHRRLANAVDPNQTVGTRLEAQGQWHLADDACTAGGKVEIRIVDSPVAARLCEREHAAFEQISPVPGGVLAPLHARLPAKTADLTIGD